MREDAGDGPTIRGMLLRRLFTAPFTDLLNGLDRCLERGAGALAGVFLGPS